MTMTMNNPTDILFNKYVVSGKEITHGFGYIESLNGEVDFSVIYDLAKKGEYNGNVAYVIRNCIEKEWIDKLANNFKKVIAKRGSHRLNDGFVSVQQVGASQFSKSGSRYIQESYNSFNDIDRVFDGIPSDIVNHLFLGAFLEENFLKKEAHFGPSRYKHGYACMATFRSWLDNGKMSLMPHEDKSQLCYAKKDDFEISTVPIVLAQNLCIEATGEGGELVIWNIQPDDNCRKSFNVSDTGYPYPPEYIEHIDKIEIDLNPGDLYFMNGCCLHGVKNVVAGKRTTVGRFIGCASDKKVVYWT